MRRLIVRNLIGVVAALLCSSVSVSAEQKGSVTLAVVGTPMPNTVIGDARHCPMKPAPVAKPSGDRVEFSLLAGQPSSITLSARRGGDVCGGSLYLVPEAGLGYVARLTPGGLCAAQLFRVDPHAQPPIQLRGTDNHPDLNDVICAAQEGSPGTSRLAIGRNARRSSLRVEIGSGGDCGKFDHVSPGESGIELASGIPQWIRLKFRTLAGFSGGVGGSASLTSCDLSIKFTPSAGATYMIETDDNSQRCEVRLEMADARGDLSMMPIELAGNTNCKSAH